MTQAIIQEKIKDFCTKMWRTAGARFNCQRRMKCRNTLSAFTISVLSVYLIAIGIFQKVYSISNSNPSLDNLLTFISIVGAVFIIVLSLIDWASDFSVKADRLFENANLIKELRTELERCLVKDLQEIDLVNQFDKISKQYELLTNGQNPNHDPVDDFLFRAQNTNEPHVKFQLNLLQVIWAYISWYFVTYGISAFILISPVATLIILAN